MKKFIFVLMGLLVASVFAGAQTTKVSDKTNLNGTTYVSQSTRGASTNNDIKTEYTWSNSKDNVSYDIYLHKYSKGDKAGQWTAYVVRQSKKTGKDYKYYLPDGEAIAKDIMKRNPNLVK